MSELHHGPVSIRPAGDADIPAVHAVRVVTWRDAYDGIIPDDVLGRLQADDSAGVAAQQERFRHAPPNTHLLVAETRGRIVGFAAIGPEREEAQPGAAVMAATEIGEIYALYVLPAEQGRGIGRALLGAALDRLSSDGFVRATLWVLEANASARVFYERCGMTATGERQPITIGIELIEVRYAITLSHLVPGT